MKNINSIIIYTDGSCHTQIKTGAWAAIIISNGERKLISGVEHNTTHNRMELLAIINAILFCNENYSSQNIEIYTDSQYAVGLISRAEKLNSKNFTSKKGNDIRNVDLVHEFLKLSQAPNINFTKVKAHVNTTSENLNQTVDKLVRKLVHENI